MAAAVWDVLEAPDHEPGMARKRFTLAEYHRLIDLGFLTPHDPIELLRGELIAKMPQNPPHYTSIELISHTLQSVFRKGFAIRSQAPVTLPDDSEPEPDIAVVRGSTLDYSSHHPLPDDIVWIVEVSDSTLGMDRKTKESIYAQGGIAEYWILNLPARQLEVHRDPVRISDRPDGFRYRSITVFGVHDTVTPLAAPKSRIQVCDILPPLG